MDLIVVSCAITSFTMDMMYVLNIKVDFLSFKMILNLFNAIKKELDTEQFETGSFQWDLTNILYRVLNM